MKILIVPNDKGNPPGKLADAELHFTEGPLEGLKLIGFGVWERRADTRLNVTFPARQYSVNGERRSFALLRPIVTTEAQERIRDLIVEAYARRYHVERVPRRQPAAVPAMKRRADGIIVKIEPTGPPLPRGGRHTAKVRQAIANYDSMQREMQAPTITPEYRRASAALDYILKVLLPGELTAYYVAVRERRQR